MSAYTGPETDEQRAERRMRNAAEDGKREAVSAKPTAGPWVIDWNVSCLDIHSADGATHIASLRRSSLSSGIDETAKANARLIAEAGTVLHETGLTPRQLAEQRAELAEVIAMCSDDAKDELIAALAKVRGS